MSAAEKNLRDKMARESKGSLVIEWTAPDKETYRLIAVGAHSKGYEDFYIIEKLEADALGEPRWTKAHEWKAGDDKLRTLLVSAIGAAGGAVGSGRVVAVSESRRSIEMALASSAQFLESLLAEGNADARIRLQAALEGVQRALGYVGGERPPAEQAPAPDTAAGRVIDAAYAYAKTMGCSSRYRNLAYQDLLAALQRLSEERAGVALGHATAPAPSDAAEKRLIDAALGFVHPGRCANVAELTELLEAGRALGASGERSAASARAEASLRTGIEAVIADYAGQDDYGFAARLRRVLDAADREAGAPPPAPASAWRTDEPPRGVRCLVTARATTSDVGILLASVSSDHDGIVWFSNGMRLHEVTAWMPCPEPAAANACTGCGNSIPDGHSTCATIECGGDRFTAQDVIDALAVAADNLGKPFVPPETPS